MSPRSLLTLLLCLTIAAAAGCGRSARETYMYPFQDPALPLEERVQDLIGLLTLEEKVGQMMNSARAIERLGIPAYDWWNEALHGVARAGRATVFPQAIGLAAIWDEELMGRVATVISDEARAKYHEAIRRDQHGIYQGLTFWSPNINIFRDPRWGRGMETYGEDPYLTGRLAVRFVQGMQGDDSRYLKTVATPKHFAVHSGPEPDRHTFDAEVDDRDLRETYLPAFRAAVVEGGAWSVMCAYNRFRGDACCGSLLLLQDILREEWGFQGYVVSDCGAIHDMWREGGHDLVADAPEAAALGVRSGTDLNCGNQYANLIEAVRSGLLTEYEIDRSLARLFRARFRLGMFDPPERVRWAQIPYDVNDAPAHAALAEEATRASIVLLENRGVLPLSSDLGVLAVIGPNADNVDVLLGNYNGIPSAPVTPLEGIRRRVSDRTRVIYAQGCEVAPNLPLMVPVPAEVLAPEGTGSRTGGLTAAWFDTLGLPGEPVRTSLEATVDHNWFDTGPGEGLNPAAFSVRWSGLLVAPVTGEYTLGVQGLGTYRLWLDGRPILRYRDRHLAWTETVRVRLVAGRSYPLRLEYECIPDRDAVVRLLWAPPRPDLMREALAAAGEADAVVLVMGLTPRLEGEEMPVAVPGFAGGDRLDLQLPQPQRELVAAVAGLGRPTVLVLLSGSALAVGEQADQVGAVVEAWYSGQAAGTALAGVLFGDYSPSGRLPVTFYRSVSDLPPFDDYRMAGRTYRYFEGDVLYPFGHGLSYTRFEYSGLRLPARVRADRPVNFSVTVRNSGEREGAEVVQLYVRDLETSVPVPVRSLQGFRRVTLRPGESRRIWFTLDARNLSLIDASGRRVVEPGRFEISVGGKQPGFTGRADNPGTGVVSGVLEVTGRVVHVPER